MIGHKHCESGLRCPRYAVGGGQWHIAVIAFRHMDLAQRDERYPRLRLIELECHVARMSNKRTSRKQAENLRPSSHQSSSSSAAPRILLDPNRRDPRGPITPSGPVPIGAKFTGLEADLPPAKEGAVWGATDDQGSYVVQAKVAKSDQEANTEHNDDDNHSVDSQC